MSLRVPDWPRVALLSVCLMALPAFISSLHDASLEALGNAGPLKPGDFNLIAQTSGDKNWQSSSPREPSFVRVGHNESVVVQKGSTAYLHCPIQNLGQREVSWVRRKDWRILTHGGHSFTSDDRISLHTFNLDNNNDDDDNDKNEEDEDEVVDWVLQIKFVASMDSGLYECQVSNGEGMMSLGTELSVVTPEAFILADEEYHIERGSTLSLVCIIERATKPPQYVFWYHNERMVNYDSKESSSSEVSVRTTPGRKTHSQLLIRTADLHHSGNYTCAPSNSLPASVHVFVSGSEVKPWTTSAAFSMSSGYLMSLVSLVSGLRVTSR